MNTQAEEMSVIISEEYIWLSPQNVNGVYCVREKDGII